MDASPPTPPVAAPGPQIRLAELVSALSYALDITEGQPAGHSIRVCWIGMHIGQQIGLPPDALAELYYTLLLKDVGCSSNAARLCQLYLADDLQLKRDYKFVDSSLPQLLRFVLSHTGMKAGLAERFRTIVNVARNGGEFARELIETRCQRGADIARQMRFSETVAKGILDLDEHWNGGGHPLGLKGEAISLGGRIALLSQVIDVFYKGTGAQSALKEIRRRAGVWFDPALVAAFEKVAADPWFWARLAAPDIEQRVIALEPARRVVTVDEDYLDDIAAAFARVIDAKSPYTSGHSDRVALFTDMIAEELGVEEHHRRRLQRAALLHDFGKLGVSSQVLDKPGKLDGEEWAEMQRHAEEGERILSHIAAFADLARVAGAHHERLDGTGYPRRLSGEALDLDTRIVAVADVFDALTADRPYRPAMPVAKAFEIMRAETGSKLDPTCFAALERAIAKADAAAA
jgi:HD-GYP domain-containing protein (c-di-GMP phosphodiesterase class II)